MICIDITLLLSRSSHEIGSQPSVGALSLFLLLILISFHFSSLAKTVHQEREKSGDVGFPVAREVPGRKHNFATSNCET